MAYGSGPRAFTKTQCTLHLKRYVAIGLYHFLNAESDKLELLFKKVARSMVSNPSSEMLDDLVRHVFFEDADVACLR